MILFKILAIIFVHLCTEVLSNAMYICYKLNMQSNESPSFLNTWQIYTPRTAEWSSVSVLKRQILPVSEKAQTEWGFPTGSVFYLSVYLRRKCWWDNHRSFALCHEQNPSSITVCDAIKQIEEKTTSSEMGQIMVGTLVCTYNAGQFSSLSQTAWNNIILSFLPYDTEMGKYSSKKTKINKY